MERREILDELDAIDVKIGELKKRMPGHTPSIAMIAELEDLEDRRGELSEALRRAEAK